MINEMIDDLNKCIADMQKQVEAITEKAINLLLDGYLRDAKHLIDEAHKLDIDIESKINQVELLQETNRLKVVDKWNI